MPAELTDNNSLGCDFVYKDLKGKLSGQRNASCYIEVKSQTHETPQDSLRLSANEWQLAEKCHQSGGYDVYCILLVVNVAKVPQVAKVLIDPVGMCKSGMLRCVWSEVTLHLLEH